MKKIITLGVASAMCALTAISASAAAASAAWANPKGEQAKDKQITIDILANGEIKDCSFIATGTGVKIESIKCPTEGLMLNNFNDKTGLFAVSGGANTIAKAGDVLCTITATVTGDAGTTAKIEVVSADDGAHTSKLPDTAYTFEIKGASTTSGDSTASGDSTTSGDSTASGDSTTSGDSKPAGDDKPNPPTGVALAVVPAVLAAAGVIVAKKRK